MRPILFHIGSFAVESHPLFAALGIIVALYFTFDASRRAGRADKGLLYLVAGGLLGAAIFARYGLVFRYLQAADEPTLAGFIRFGGRSVLGGLVGGYLGVVVTKRVLGYKRATGDLFAPGVALGMGIGRIGCFLAERPGTVTTLPWSVRVPADAAALVPQCPACLTGAPMHPSFVYEMIFDVVAAWVLFRVLRPTREEKIVGPRVPWLVEGDVFKAFLFAYAVFRFFVEFVRGNPAMWLGMSGSQVMALISIVLFAAYFMRRRRTFKLVAVAA